METALRPTRGYALFAMAVTIGGMNFLAVRVSNRELEPFWGAGLRFSLAAALFVTYTLVRRLPWPRGRHLLLTVLYGLVGISGFYALMYWALVRVTAGAATVVLALVPLVTLILAGALGLERLRRRAVLGAVLALAGIAWMVLGPGQVELPLAALLAMLGATLCTGLSVIVGKILSSTHPGVTNAIALTVGAVSLLVMSALTGERWALPQQPAVRWSLVYLVILGSVGLFVLLLLVVRLWTASATAYAFVLFPVVTMLLGDWLLDEPVTFHGATGAALVMAGAWFGALAQPNPRSTAVNPVEVAVEHG